MLGGTLLDNKKLIILLVMCIFFVTGCSAQHANVGVYIDDKRDVLIGELTEPEIMRASDVVEWDLGAEDFFVDIEEILAKREKSKVYNEMVAVLKMYAEMEDCSLFGADKCYVSVVPIHTVDVNKRDLIDWIQVTVLPEDKNSDDYLTLNLLKGKRKSDVEITCTFPHKLVQKGNPNSIFRYYPSDKLIYLKNNGHSYAIDANNEVLMDSSNTEYVFEGDYYHALNYELLAVSFDEIVADENLVEVEIN